MVAWAVAAHNRVETVGGIPNTTMVNDASLVA